MRIPGIVVVFIVFAAIVTTLAVNQRVSKPSTTTLEDQLAAAAKAEATSKQKALKEKYGAKDVDVDGWMLRYIDMETGCHYLRGHDRDTSFTPRMRADGTHMCEQP